MRRTPPYALAFLLLLAAVPAGFASDAPPPGPLDEAGLAALAEQVAESQDPVLRERLVDGFRALAAQGAQPDPPAGPEPQGTEVASASGYPALVLGRPTTFAAPFNFHDSGRGADGTLCFDHEDGGEDCVLLTHQGSANAFAGSSGRAQAEAFEGAASITYSAISLLTNAIKASVHGLSTREGEAWAMVGAKYDVVRGCAEQPASMPATVRMRYGSGAYVQAKSKGLGWAEAVSQVAAVPFAPTHGAVNPVAWQQKVDDEFLRVSVDEGLWETRSNRYDWGTGSRAWSETLQTGPGVTYLGISGFALAGSAFLGHSEATMDGFSSGRGLLLESISVDFSDPTPPTSTAHRSGVAGKDDWYRSAVTVTLEGRDAESCVQGIIYRVDGGAWRVVPVDSWNPRLSFVLASEGRHTVEYRAVNGYGRVEGTRTVAVNIDFRPPTVALTRPGAWMCYVQDVPVRWWGTPIVPLGAETNMMWEACAAGTRMTLASSASDLVSGVDVVEFHDNGHTVGSDHASPYEAPWDLVAATLDTRRSLGGDGLLVHRVQTCAADKAGNRACDWGRNVFVPG